MVASSGIMESKDYSMVIHRGHGKFVNPKLRNKCKRTFENPFNAVVDCSGVRSCGHDKAVSNGQTIARVGPTD